MPKLISEDANQFQIEQDNGSILPVAKAALSESEQLKYRSYPPAGANGPASGSGIWDTFKTILGGPNGPAAQPMGVGTVANKQAVQENLYPAMPEVPVEEQAPAMPLVQQAPQAPAGPHVQTNSQTQQSTSRTGLSDEGKAFAAQVPGLARDTGNAVQGVANAQSVGAELTADAMVKGIAVEEAAAAAMAKRQQERDAELDKQMTEYERVVDETAKFKPKDFFEDNSKITAGIAIMLGALGQGISGKGSNMGLDAVNQEIERHGAREKAKYEQLRDKTQGAQTTYGMLVTRLGSQEKADAAMYAIGVKIAQDKVAAIAQASKSDIIKAEAVRVQAELDQKANESMLSVADRVTQNTAISTTTQRETNKPADVSLTIPGVGQAYDKEGAQLVRKEKTAVEKINGSLNQLLMISKLDGKSISVKNKADAEVLVGTLVGQLRESITGPGAMSDGDRALLEKLVANPTNIFSLDDVSRAKLMKIKDTVNKGFQSTLGNYVQGYAKPSPASLGVIPRK